MPALLRFHRILILSEKMRILFYQVATESLTWYDRDIRPLGKKAQMSTKAADDLLEDYGIPYSILDSLTDEVSAELVRFVETAVSADRHALVAWIVNEGFLDDLVLSAEEKEKAVKDFYTKYDDTYTSEEDFVRAYFRERVGVPDEALDFLDVNSAYTYLVERRDNKFFRLDLGGNAKGFAIFEKNPL